MKIPIEILNRCYAHAIEAYPEEACGFISGSTGIKDALNSVHKMKNVMSDYHAQEPEIFKKTNLEGFMIDFREHGKLEKRLKGGRHEIKIIYHSHPNGKANFSDEDREMALCNGEPVYPGVRYLILSTKGKKPNGAVLASFEPDKKDFEVLRVD